MRNTGCLSASGFFAWKQSENAVLYVDTTTLMTCRAAFTGGGSHSDIYRRETASFLWDLIR